MDVFHPVSYTIDHSLSGVQSHGDLEIAHMCFTQSRDCAYVLCNLEMALTCYAIPRLPVQSWDSENAQIPRLRGTYTLFNYKPPPPPILVANKKGGGL